MTDLRDTQPFTPSFDDTGTVPLPPPVRHRKRHRHWLPGIGLILVAGAVGVVWALAQAGPAGPATVVGPTSYATTRVTPGGTVSVPTDGASMPSSPGRSATVAAVAVSSVRRAPRVAVRPSVSASVAHGPSQSPSVAVSLPAPSPSGSSAAPSDSPSTSPSISESESP